MKKDIAYYNELFQKIESGTATPEEIEEEKKIAKETDKMTSMFLEELFMDMGSNQQIKHFILGTYCLYKVCEQNKCTDMLISGIQKLGIILERSSGNNP